MLSNCFTMYFFYNSFSKPPKWSLPEFCSSWRWRPGPSWDPWSPRPGPGAASPSCSAPALDALSRSSGWSTASSNRHSGTHFMYNGIEYFKVSNLFLRQREQNQWWSGSVQRILDNFIWIASRTDTNLQVTIETFLSNIKCIKMYKCIKICFV